MMLKDAQSDEEFDEGLSDSGFHDLAEKFEGLLGVSEELIEPLSLSVSLDYTEEDALTLLSREEILSLEEKRIDARLSPFERFRARKGHLSVTDLVSPAWCESQFQYSLEKGGRKRRTKAMTAGTKIHSNLEQELSTLVPFQLDEEVQEEIFGLRLVNILCGLLGLEHATITRELPVLGYVDKVLVYGVIDQIRYAEIELISDTSQATLDSYLVGSSRTKRQAIISDTKTRVHYSMPSTGQEDQAKHQLMLYWRLLHDMGTFDIAGYLLFMSLDGERAFSDSFLAQVVNTVEVYGEEITVEALDANCINGVWRLLVPRLASLTQHLSEECRIQYIHQSTSKPIIEKSFFFDATWLQQRTNKALEWWIGRREADGVPIEEAYKCRLCEMEPGCSFRLGKIEELRIARAKKPAVLQQQW